MINQAINQGNINYDLHMTVVIMLTTIMVMTEVFIEKITEYIGNKEPDGHV